jgi:hypothetical protein
MGYTEYGDNKLPVNLVYIYRFTQSGIPEDENSVCYDFNPTSEIIILNAKKNVEYLLV